MAEHKKESLQDVLKESVQEDIENVEWGENCQERLVDHCPRHKSLRHVCKGRGCESGFEKL